jgi:RND family efflux transporter MFP subunit
MKGKLITKSRIISLLIVIVGSIVLIFLLSLFFRQAPKIQAQSVAVRQVSSSIQANGSVASQNEATLHFQTGGKLTYLSAKEGDKVYQGQTIASLDTYALQKQLQITANNYQITKNSTEETSEENQAGVLEGKTRTGLDTANKDGYQDSSITEAQVITDAVKRMVDNSILTQNSAQLNLDLANYAVTLASIQAPFSGILYHEDVNTPNVNVTPATSFVVVDPTALLFKAYVASSDIDFVSVGAKATISLNGNSKIYEGTVEKIYPEKTTLSSGEEVYRVDIASVGLENAKYAQTGSVQIASNIKGDVKLVPTWTILNGDSIWILSNGKMVLKNIKIGKTHQDMTEVLSGLESDDKVITNPRSVVSQSYQIL